MSRTYNTDPIRVRASRSPHRVISHGYRCEFAESRWGLCVADEYSCNISSKNTSWSDCRYTLPPSEEIRHHWYTDTPGRVDCHYEWWGPSRAEETRRLTEIVKDYRANGEVDHVELDHQYHRHGISYYW